MSYTYLIGWSKQNKWYYGARAANKVIPELDLWKEYFTSSNFVLHMIREYGDPDIIEVRRVFKDDHKCFEWEEKVLRKLNVLEEDKWLNRNIGGKKFNNLGGCELTQEQRRKMGKPHIGRKLPKTHIANMQVGLNIVKATPEYREHMRLAKLGSKYSDTHCANISEGQKRRWKLKKEKVR